MSDIPDLWPQNIGTTDMVTPVTILKSQAALLGEKTQQLIKAEVHTQGGKEKFWHFFYLVVPALDNYKFELFKASHGMFLYPVTILEDLRVFKAEDEKELLGVLSTVFNNPRTIDLVGSLIAQAKD